MIVKYEIGLANFDTFNLIPNDDKINNLFISGDKDKQSFEIPSDSYELKDLIEIIQKKLQK